MKEREREEEDIGCRIDERNTGLLNWLASPGLVAKSELGSGIVTGVDCIVTA